MSFTLTQYLLVSLILLASSVVQGAVGFAAGLFGIPLLMMTGTSLPEALAISLVAAAAQNCTAAWKLRGQIDYRAALRPMLIRFATLPLGALVLAYVGQSSKDLTSQIVGGVVLAIVALQGSLRVERRPHLHPAWEWAAFGSGGFLLGLCGMGGPPMVLWVMAHDWPMIRAKAFLYYIFATGIPLQCLVLWLFFGTPILESMLLGLVTLPAVIAGIYPGLWIGSRLPDHVLRPLAWGVLVLIGISAIVSPWLNTG